MKRFAAISLSGLAAAALAHGAVQPVPGGGIGVKDLKRVEQGRGDAGGLSKSLAVGPAELRVPNDFSGVYQIPSDADSPYAGWFARVQGAMIAVFPRGEYTSTPDGAVARVPANTRFFIGRIPTSDVKRAVSSDNLAVERVDRRIDGRADRLSMPPPVQLGANDTPPPPTVDGARTPAEVTRAMNLLCTDQTYRANRLRELVARALDAESDDQ